MSWKRSCKKSARSTVRSIARPTKEGASFIASHKEVFPAGVPEPGLRGRGGKIAAKLKS